MTSKATLAAAPAASRAALRLGTEHFREANEKVRAALAETDALALEDVHAQRYLGCAMPEGKRLEIHGTPGNDLACYMDGGSIEVFGNAQDQVGNTMNGGEVVIHGRCGDATGYGMRGGRIFIRDDCGWRVGVHMKEYADRRPAIVIGGHLAGAMGVTLGGRHHRADGPCRRLPRHRHARRGDLPRPSPGAAGCARGPRAGAG